MSITINPGGLPDVNELQQLANSFFKSIPGDFSEFKIGESTNSLQHPGVDDISNPPSSLPDPHFTDGKAPSSVAGLGISPNAASSGKPENGNFGHVEPIGINPDFNQHSTYFSGAGIPPSVSQYATGATGYPSFLEKANFDKASVNNYLPFSGIPSLDEHLYQNSGVLSKPDLKQPDFHQLPGKDDFYFLSENEFQNPFNNQGITSIKPLETHSGLSALPFNAALIKKDFPILRETINGKPLIWLDNAATTQKPQSVIDRIAYFYEHENSNIHRAAHELAARATDAYEEARKKVQNFINAGSINEIVFVRGATEAINLVAKSWGAQNLTSGDEIILSNLEHHANIVPWQQLAAKKGLKIKVIPVDDSGQILLDEYAKLLSSRTKLVSFTQVSNALGTVTPAKQMVEMAHQAGAKVLVDGAQSVSHMRVDVQSLNCDWFVFSGHKVFGPTGIGVLYGKEDLLNETEPWQGGGNMIEDVTFEHTKFHKAPGRFEAGTGNIADAVGLGAAIDYVNKIGIDLINKYEHNLLEYATRLIKDVSGLRIIGTAADKASVLSFVLEGYRSEEVGYALNQEGIAVRSGHHCAQPILRRFGLEATVRPSLAFYNTCSDVDVLIKTLHRLRDQKPIRK